MAIHSSVLAWRIPGTGQPGGLPSMGSHGVGHDWNDLAAAAAAAAALGLLTHCLLFLKYPSSHRFTGLCALIPPQPLRPTPHSAHSSGCIFTPGCNFLSICFLRWTIDFTRTETVSCVCIVAQLCLTLCDPKDCNPPGSSVYGIFQARILEWVAIPPPGDLPHPGIEPASWHLLHWQADSLPLSHLGSIIVS